MNEYTRIIIFSVLSAFLIYLSKDRYLLDLLIQNNILSASINCDLIQRYAFALGTIWSLLWLPIEHVNIKRNNNRLKLKYTDLLQYNKQNLMKIIKNEIKEQNTDLNTRIFVPEPKFKSWINKFIFKKTILKLIEIPGLSDKFHHQTLKFEIKNNSIEGMVGKSYKEKALCIDLDLNNNNTYQLTEEQKLKIGNLGFCSSIPIFNNHQNKIRAILAVDSQKSLNFDDNKKKKWEQHMIFYAAFVDKHM